MKTLLKILLCILSVIILLFIILCVIIDWPFVPADEPWVEKYDKSGLQSSIRIVSETVPLEQQISVLAELGYQVKPEIETKFYENIKSSGGGWPSDVLERYPFWLVFTALGWEYEDEHGEVSYYSDSTYCLEDRYSDYDVEDLYVKSLEQISRISHGELNLNNATCEKVGFNRRTLVSYVLNDDIYKWSIPNNNGYNPNVLEKISQYSFNDEHEKNLYWTHDEHGFHVIYCTEKDLRTLGEVTGINFYGLDNNQLPLFS